MTQDVLPAGEGESTGAGEAGAPSPAVEPDGGVPLVQQLPRPNLGLEPWPEGDGGRQRLAVAVGVVVVVLAAAALWFLRGRVRRRRPVPTPLSDGMVDIAGDGPGTARDRLIRAADDIRRAFVRRFGPHWAAKTTEEIADEAAVVEWLGPERAEVVLGLLAEADRAKFASIDGEPAGESDGEDQGDEWEAVALEVETSALEGAMSRMKGR